jgi:hypothetical protein
LAVTVPKVESPPFAPFAAEVWEAGRREREHTVLPALAAGR